MKEKKRKKTWRFYDLMLTVPLSYRDNSRIIHLPVKQELNPKNVIMRLLFLNLRPRFASQKHNFKPKDWTTKN